LNLRASTHFFFGHSDAERGNEALKEGTSLKDNLLGQRWLHLSFKKGLFLGSLSKSGMMSERGVFSQPLSPSLLLLSCLSLPLY